VILTGCSEDIAAIAKGHSGIVTASQVTAAGIPRRVLSEMTASGQLAKIERGIYLLGGGWEYAFLVY
jgi:predicted transcriptional regulator of viral defense system